MTHHLVLGGLGFIGRHTALALALRGEPVTVVDRRPPPPEFEAAFEAAFDGLPLVFRQAEIASVEWEGLLENVNVVHHYAWSTIPQTANDDPLGDLDENVRSSVRLLEALRRFPGKRLVFASSGGTVYGRLNQTPVPETHHFAPITAYGVSKASVEMYLGFYRAYYGLDCRVARISNPFGAGQDPRRPQGAASAFVFKAMAGEEIAIWGDGSVVRDYIHISDLAEGLISLAEAPAELCGDPPVFNIASGVGISLNDIIEILTEHLGVNPRVLYHPGRAFDLPVSVLDIALARDRLGWSPRFSFAEGCERMIRDLSEGRHWLSALPRSGDGR
jgi:UDP-glucose 4-epimerase